MLHVDLNGDENEKVLLYSYLNSYHQTGLKSPLEEVDQEYIEKPKRWDIRFIRRFMVCLGPVSSLFDFLTFFIMLYVFNAYEQLF